MAIRSLIFAGVSAVLAQAGMAAQITISGSFQHGQNGAIAPLALGQTTTQNFSLGSASSGNALSGTVVARNISTNGQQTLELSLSNFLFSGTGSQNRTITITMVQEFAVQPGQEMMASALHRMGGFVNVTQAGQMATGSMDAIHESTNLPRVQFNPGQGQSIGPAQSLVSRFSNPVNVTVSGTYRMETTYVLTLNAGGGSMNLNFTDGFHQSVNLMMVPLPASGWAAVAGLAMVGGVSGMRRLRRRDLSRA